ncbi:MAG: hypothetical protein AAF223_08965, partial [Bacteroidota bacterium]
MKQHRTLLSARPLVFHSIGILAIISIVSFSAIAQTGDEINDPNDVGINKIKPHALLLPYDTPEQAQQDEPENPPYYQSLNGSWKFAFS